MAELGKDLPDEDELVGGFLKSLVNTTGLQATWQSVAKRLQVLEQGLRRVQQTMDKLPRHYVKREEFHELVETQHAKLLNDHDEMLKQNNEIIQTLSSANDKQPASMSRNCLACLEIQKQLETRFQRKLDSVEKLAQDFRAEVVHQMTTNSGKLHDHFNEIAFNAEQLKTQVEDGLATAAKSLHEAKHNMQISTQQKVDNMIDNLCSNKSSPKAAQLLSFISKSLVEPFATQVTRAAGELDALTQKLAKQEDLFFFVQRSQEKAMSEMAAKLQDTSTEFQEQLNTCNKKVDADQAKQELERGLASLARQNDYLRSKVIVKLNEFVEHIEKMNTTIQDHEHCLRHHAEEIENRSTKYDLLACRHLVDNCVTKAQFHREFGELKKVVSWHSGKIENFGLNNGSSMRPRKHQRRVRSKMHSLKSSVDGESSSEASYGGTSSVAHQQIMPQPKYHFEPEELVQPMLDNVEEQDEVIAGGGSEFHRASSRISVADSGAEDSWSECSGSNSTLVLQVLQQQLEAVSMGVLGLAHLALKEVRLGTSRNARLVQEKEMLEELANVRHWITNKVVPSGWDPSKITTLALRCTHPRKDEIKGPSAQVSVKTILELNEEPRVLQKRNLSSDPRAGAKVPGDSGSDTSNKPSLSTRGHPCATRLPPLEGLLAAN